MQISPSSCAGKMQQAARVSTAQADAASQSVREVQPEVASAVPEHCIQKKTTFSTPSQGIASHYRNVPGKILPIPTQGRN